ncbi:hypothetical protein ACUTJJ_11960 [Agrobacterium sp. DKPNP3]|uniref:hypothetical protein n=1 Tax=Agrobacterium sp. DKPNP3 TaxID=3457323 RepID=UPI0040450750
MTRSESRELNQHCTCAPHRFHVIDIMQTIGKTHGHMIAIATDELDGGGAVIAFYMGRG